MNDKDFNSMRQQRRPLLSEDKKKTKSPVAELLNKRLFDFRKKPQQDGFEGEKKEEKTPIWWAITIFCIVYGIEVVYNILIGATP